MPEDKKIHQFDDVVLEDLTGEEAFALSFSGWAASKKMTLEMLSSILGGDSRTNIYSNIVFVSDSLELTSEHENKFIICGSDSVADIQLSMPNDEIFIGGKLSILFLTNGCYQSRYNSDFIYPVYKVDGVANDVNTIAELSSFYTYSESGTSSFLPVTSYDAVVKDVSDGNKSKTITRFLYDKSKNEQIITLGTITFEDVNAAAAAGEIFFTLTNIPSGYYPEKIFQKVTAFDTAEITNAGVQSVLTGVNTNAYLDVSANTVTIVSLSDYTNVTQDYNDLQFRITFDTVNPQNLNDGIIDIKALIRKFPI